jgi:hypothetical protein
MPGVRAFSMELLGLLTAFEPRTCAENSFLRLCGRPAGMGSLDCARDDIGWKLEVAELCSAGRAWTPVPTWPGVNGLGLRPRTFEAFFIWPEHFPAS